MRFSLQPEPRPEQRMRTVHLDEILSICGNVPGERPMLEHYFSPTKKEAFIKEFLHFLNSELLEAKHGHMDSDQYLVFVLSFQFTAPLLKIPSEKELVKFYGILQKTYKIEDFDLNLHFGLDEYEGEMVSEKEAIQTYRDELKDTYNGHREVKERVQKRLRDDAIEAIMLWQKDQTIPALATAFGRSIVIPSFFTFVDKKLVNFYRETTGAILYRVAIPGELG